MNDRIHLSLAFLAAALCDGALWPLGEETRRTLAAGLLLASLLLHLARVAPPGARPAKVRVPLLLGALAGLALAPTPSLAVLAIALFTWLRGVGSSVGNASLDGAREPGGPASLGARIARRISEPVPAAAGLALFALFVEVRLLGPVRVACESLAAALCALAGAGSDAPLELGPTALGLDLAILAFLMLRAGSGLGRRALVRTASTAVGLLGLVLGYAVAFREWIDATRSFTREASEEGPEIFAGILLLGGILALWVAFAKRPTTSGPRPAFLAAAAACLALAGIPRALAAQEREGELAGAKVLLVEASESDDRFEGFPVPSYGYYQNENYRAFRRWLEAWGCDVRIQPASALEARDLAEIDLVVCVTPASPSVGPLLEYAKSGGSLLVLGDHTPPPEELDRLNQFLASFGLSHAFDSAFPNAATERSLRAGAARLRTALARSADAAYGVGASLRADATAEVLLESRWGVGDLGFADSDVLLGNRHYDHGDRLSDLPVAVSGTHAGGKVVLVGDTGPFVDSALPFSHPFVRALVAEALARPRLDAHARNALVLVLLAAAVLAARRAAPACVAALAIGFAPAWESRPAAVDPGPGLVAIDFSLSSLTASAERNPRTSIKGFAYQAAVQGRRPAVTNDLGAALAADPEIVVLISPAQEPSTALRAELRTYVEGGGELWLAVGHEEIGGLRQTLAELGLAVLARPLGSSTQRSAKDGARYREAWEVVAERGSRSESLLEAFGRPIVRRVALGRGRVTLFGDSYFLCDENVGTGEVTHAESERFLAGLFGE